MPILWPFKGTTGLAGMVAIGGYPTVSSEYASGLQGILYSPNGETWTPGNPPANDSGIIAGKTWTALCAAFGNDMFLVGGSPVGYWNQSSANKHGLIQASSDGINWTMASTPYDTKGNYSYNSVISLAYGNGVWLAMVGYVGTYGESPVELDVISSTDGLTWTTAATGVLGGSIIYDPVAELFVILGSLYSSTSTNGTTWTAVEGFPNHTPDGYNFPWSYNGLYLNSSPFIFSGGDWRPWDGPTWFGGYGIPSLTTGQTPAPSTIQQWLPLLPAVTTWSILDPYGPDDSVATYVQACYQDASGNWNMGGWNGPHMVAGVYTNERWVFCTPTRLGTTSTGLTGFIQMTHFVGVYGTNGPPDHWLSAAVTQGAAPEDFYIVGLTNGFSKWQRPPYTQPVGEGSSGTGSGPTISLTGNSTHASILAGCDCMWVYGPVNIALLNGNGVLVAVQGSDSNGQNASPVYVFAMEESDSADFADYYSVDSANISALPAPPAGGVVGAMCDMVGNNSRGGEVPLEGCVVLWCYQPNGDGTYSPWSLAYDGLVNSWVKLGLSLDVKCTIGGFRVSGDNTTLYFAGWSPSANGYVMVTANTSTLVVTTIWNTPLPTTLSDGFPTSMEPYLPTLIGPPYTLGIPPAEVGSILNMQAALPTENLLIDLGTASYLPEGGTEDAVWLRYITTIGGTYPSSTVQGRYLNGCAVQVVGAQSISNRVLQAGIQSNIGGGAPGLPDIWLNSNPGSQIANTNDWAENVLVWGQNSGSAQNPTAQVPTYLQANDISYGNGVWVVSMTPFNSAIELVNSSGAFSPPFGNTPVSGVQIAVGSLSSTPGKTLDPGMEIIPPFFLGDSNTSFINTCLCFDGTYFWAGLWENESLSPGFSQIQALWRSPDGTNWTYVPTPFDGVQSSGSWYNGAITGLASSYGFPGFSSSPSVPPPVVTASPTSPVITGISATTTSVTLDWEAPSTGSVNSYEVLMSTTSNGSQSIVLTVSGSTTTGTITGLASDTEYFFQVLAVQSANNTVSNEVSTYTSGVPAGGSGTGGSSGGGTSGASGTYSDWANPYTSSFTDALSNPQAAPGSAGIVAAVVAMQVSSGYDMGVNTMSIVVVPTTQAYVSVGGGNANFSTAPIPSYASGLLNGSGDSPLVVYMPSVGAWEMWQALDNSGWTTADGAYITASQMAASTGAVAPGTGYGIAASGLSYLGTAITLADCERVINGATDFGHVIALEVSECEYHALGHVPPADRHDGGLGSGTNGYPMEGMWFYLPSGAVTAPSNAFALAVYNTLMRYGCVVTDTTQGGGNYLQAEQSSDWAAQGGTGTDPFTTLLGGQATYDVLAPFSGSGSIMSHLVQIIPPLTGSPPGSAPSAPSISSVTGSSGQLAVSWSGSASMFIVAYRVTGSGAAFEVSYPDTESTSATITGLSNGTEYDVQIWAVNGSGYTASGVSTGTP